MITAANIKPGKVFIGKSGLKRLVNKFKVCGIEGSEFEGDVYYTPIDRSGKKGKEMSCHSSSFVKWAVEEVLEDKLKPSDLVVMQDCFEARKEKNMNKVWKVTSEPRDFKGSEVVTLEGYDGVFATKYLKKWKEQ